MRLSAPIYRLKRTAKLLARDADIPLNKALDRVARTQGFQSWSQLAARDATSSRGAKILSRLSPGDMVLLGARPGQGKTLLGLEIIIEAVKSGIKAHYYTLEDTEREVISRFKSIGGDINGFKGHLTIDTSDSISANYIIEQQQTAQPGEVITVDYLQLLDQNRRKPALNTQVAALKSFATQTGSIMIFIAQIDRSYDLRNNALPSLADIRLPNPINLDHFTQTCFLQDGEVQLEKIAS